MSQPVTITLALRPPSFHSLSWPTSSTLHTPQLERRHLQDPATSSFQSVHTSGPPIHPPERTRDAAATLHSSESHHRVLSCNNSSGTTATSLVTASTRIRRKRRGTQSSLLGYLTRSAGLRGVSSAPSRHRSKSTGGETRPSYLQTLSATSATIARALARSPFSSSSPSLPPCSAPIIHTSSPSSSSSSSSSSSPSSASAHPTPPSCQICDSILAQEQHPISQSGSSPRSYWQEHRYYQAYDRIKQQVLESKQRQWEAMTEYWQWQLWHRESALGEHEYDQEREAQAQASTMHSPAQYATAVAPSTLMMNQQYCPQELAHARSSSQARVPTTHTQARIHHRTLPPVKPVSSLDTTPPTPPHQCESLAPMENSLAGPPSSGATEPRGESDEFLPTMDKRRWTRPIQHSDTLTPGSESAVAPRPPTPLLNQREGYRIRTLSPARRNIAPPSSSTSLPPTHSLDNAPRGSLITSTLSSSRRYPVEMQRSCSESRPSTGEEPVSRPYSPIRTVRHAGERGRLLAQRSKTSLNRLLNSVIDNAAALTAESISRHNLASGEKHCRPRTPPTRLLRRPSPKPRQISKVKFFVADDEDSDYDDSETDDLLDQQTLATDARHSDANGQDHSQYKRHDLSAKDDSSAQPSHCLLPPPSIAPKTATTDSPGAMRRQSLLSDLLMAEKLSIAQRPPASSTLNYDFVGCPAGPLSLDPSSGYHSASNSDGESSHPSTYSKQHAYPSALSAAQQSPQSNLRRPHQYREHPYSQQGYQRHEFPLAKASLGHGREHRPSLIRTRKSMFKNLDELAALTSTLPAAAEGDVVKSSILSSSSPSSLEFSDTDSPAKSRCTVPPVVHHLANNPVTSSIARAVSSHALHQTHPHAVLSSTVNTNTNACCSHPTTATTTACATASATSKMPHHVSSAATMATAATGGNILSSSSSGWARAHVPTQIHSVYGLLTSSVQRALSTVSTAS